jgi:hypothetical protein
VHLIVLIGQYLFPDAATATEDEEAGGVLSFIEKHRFPFFVLALIVEITILGIALWVTATKIVGE